jgi:hypothetical protein
MPTEYDTRVQPTDETFIIAALNERARRQNVEMEKQRQTAN